MKTKIMLAVSIVTTLVLFSGCEESKQVETGFLSDYSKLQKESDTSLRYVNNEALAKYSSFMVDPVKMHFHSGAESKGQLTEQQITDLTNYLHTKILEAVQGAGKKVAYQPAAGVARIRMALTDIKRSSEISMLPQASLMGAGIGGASIEAEVVDSMTGEQIGAVLESAKGSNIPLANLGDWTAAKSVMDGWAARFQKRLEGSR